MTAEPRAIGETAPLGLAGFALERDAFGRLVMRLADGTAHVGVAVARAFPISAPDEGVSIVDPDGHELVWIARPSGLPADTRALLEDELARREFMPVIQHIRGVSSFVTPCTWDVTTDRGETRFVLPGEEAIRRLTRTTLMIGDSHGIHYLVRDVESLDRASRKLLDRFL